MHTLASLPIRVEGNVALEPAQILQDGLMGAGVGAIAAKALVHRMERRGRELSPLRVRQVEFVWTCVGGGIALLIGVGFRIALK
jgi:hypothetical protein